MKKILSFRGALLGALAVCGFSAIAQPVAVELYSCPQATTFSYLTPDTPVPKSDDVCDSGTEVLFSVTGDTQLYSAIDVYRDGTNAADRPIGIDITWVPGGAEGVIIIFVEYKRWNWEGVFQGCHSQTHTIGTYTIKKQNKNPGGTLTPVGVLNGSLTYAKSYDGPVDQIQLTYAKSPSYTPNVTNIHYWINGVDAFFASSSLYAFNRNFGSYTFTTEIQNDCGNWLPGPTATVQIVPTCYDDEQGNVTRTLSGSPFTYHSDVDGFSITKDLDYKISVTGVTDWLQNYNIDYADGSSDITPGVPPDDDQFSISNGLGKYQITFENKSGRSACPTIDPLNIFLGGRDVILEEKCPLIVPDNLAKFGYNPANLVLEHFSATLKSNSYIEVRPGVTLDLGAELELLPGNIVANDLTMNYVENRSYDEYGRPLMISRTYADDRGRPVQLQSKDLSAGVILTSQTLYDATGRAAISTLVAPTDVRTTDPEAECPEVGEIGLSFTYGGDFVKDANGNPYSHLNFDDDKEENPDPVGSEGPGTLGWYYSTNNGGATSTQAPLNESLTPVTNFPYSRTLWHDDGSGDVRGSTRPGDAFRAGLEPFAESNSEKVLANDSELDSYLDVYEEVLTRPTQLDNQFFRSVSINEDNQKSITYFDNAGKAVISLYYGTGSNPITRSYNIYDQAGRLLVSIPPNGVTQFNGTNYSTIEKMTYKYNHKGWVTELSEPDAGVTKYMYRNDGKIRFSQNAEQASPTSGGDAVRYSYTNYDGSGRAIESGEYVPGVSGMSFLSGDLKAVLESISTNGGIPDNVGTKRNRLYTQYDLADIELPIERTQRFVHGAVSRTRYDKITRWYSYDEQGRVEWMVQKIDDELLSPEQRIKTLDYRYGPVGAVEEVVYQADESNERFSHFYEYDANGRMSKVYTTTEPLEYSKDGKLTNAGALTLQASYRYYKHGGLKRVEYAADLQGIDYVYNVDGSLKSINDAVKTNDPGQDGSTNGFEEDVFGMTLDYFTNDYVNGDHTPSTESYAEALNHFNGLLKGNRWHSPVESTAMAGYGYTYDPRNQMAGAMWTMPSATSTLKYAETIGNYDLNGNIMSLNRKNSLASNIANFSYNYSTGSNKLNAITDAGNSNLLRGYDYNKIGQLIEQEDVPGSKTLKSKYDVSGKLMEVRDTDDMLAVSFTYDDVGFRSTKIVYDENEDPKFKTWYVRDGTGMVMSTYEMDISGEGTLVLTDQPVYGVNRIGMYKPQYDLTFYELNDHLGNVRAVIGDNTTMNYLATMETERASNETDFIGITSSPTASGTGFINHTGPSVTVDGTTDAIADPDEVIRINNGITHQPIGGGIMLWVHPGDKIDASVFVKYQGFDDLDNDPVTGVAGYLSTVFGAGSTIVDGVSIFTGVQGSPTGAFAALSNVDDTRPLAFLNYIVFDRNMVPKDFKFDQVTCDAEMPEVDPQLHAHEQLSVNDIQIEKEGYVFIYVSNQSDQNMDVYFDDLLVTHTYSNIVAGGDYYPFGLEIKDRTITRERYRHGYQGQYSEKDEETGWNHFQLREYDPVVGRWTSRDPRNQYPSPYVGMGNNPTSGIDPTGGEKTDWYKNQDGLVQWFDDDAGEFTDADGNSWTNIGTEYFVFDGQYMNYWWQTGNESEGRSVHSKSYHAVSGAPIKGKDGWFTFDYSDERQKLENVGPIPEGLYTINKSDLQLLRDMPYYKRELLAPFGVTAWPGGSTSWGNHRWWPTEVGGTNVFGRSGFSIHGGDIWGSRGCIDLGLNMTAFARDVMGNASNETVHLNVQYTTPAITIFHWTTMWKEK